MTNGRSKSETLGDMQRLLAAITANSADLPQLEVSRSSFEALVSQALSLSQEQVSLTASKQETTQQLSSILTEVRRLATVLRFAVKQHYGISSEKLAEFGLQPFRGRARRRPPEPPPAELTSTGTPTDQPDL